MGKQVKRVPINFDWPLNLPWWGYELPEVICKVCSGAGKVIQLLSEDVIKKNELWRVNQPVSCPTCDGKGKIRPVIEIPTGEGYQLWNTSFCIIPMSPVFATPESLANWLTDHEVCAFGISRLTYEQWLEFILEKNELLCTLIKSQLESYTDRLDAFSLNFIEELFAPPPVEAKVQINS